MKRDTDKRMTYQDCIPRPLTSSRIPVQWLETWELVFSSTALGSNLPVLSSLSYYCRARERKERLKGGKERKVHQKRRTAVRLERKGPISQARLLSSLPSSSSSSSSRARGEEEEKEETYYRSIGWNIP